MVLDLGDWYVFIIVLGYWFWLVIEFIIVIK